MEIYHVFEYDDWSKNEECHGYYLKYETAKKVYGQIMSKLKSSEVFLDQEDENNFELKCGLYMSNIEVCDE